MFFFDQSFQHPIDGKYRSATAPLLQFLISGYARIKNIANCFRLTRMETNMYTKKSSLLQLNNSTFYGFDLKTIDEVSAA